MNEIVTTDRRLWRTAGWLVLGYVVLTFAGVAFQYSLMLGDGPAQVREALVSSSMPKNFAGGYVEYLATLLYLVGGLLVVRLVRSDTSTGAWLQSCATAALTARIAVTVGVGFAAGAASLYDGHHGVDLATITTVNDIRNFAFFLTGGLEGVFVLAVCGSVLATRCLPSWVAIAGMVLGALDILTIPGARAGLMNVATLGGFVWLVALAVALLRRSRATAGRSADMVPAVA
jgi:hypothetical protein